MSKKTKIEGGCHCGNIQYQFEIESSIENLSIRACTCSFCTKQGVLYTSDPKGKLSVDIKSNKDVRKYQFSSKHINFVFCSICGVMPIVTTEINNNLYALINIKTANKELLDLPVRVFDFSSETESESINRRKSKWIPSVEGV